MTTLLCALAHWNNHHLLTMECHGEYPVQSTLVVGYQPSEAYPGRGLGLCALGLKYFVTAINAFLKVVRIAHTLIIDDEICSI